MMTCHQANRPIKDGASEELIIKPRILILCCGSGARPEFSLLANGIDCYLENAFNTPGISR